MLTRLLNILEIFLCLQNWVIIWYNMYIIKRSEDAGTSSLLTTAAFKGGRLYKVQK